MRDHRSSEKATPSSSDVPATWPPGPDPKSEPVCHTSSSHERRAILSVYLKEATEHIIDLDQSVTYLIARVADQLERRVSQALAPTGLTLGELEILAHVARRPGASSSDLARRLLISRQAANVIIIRLVSDQMLERTPGSPRQRLALKLAPAGREALRAAESVASNAEAEAISLAGGPPLETVRAMLHEYIKSLYDADAEVVATDLSNGSRSGARHRDDHRLV